jgi:hypothetical protein
VNNTRIMKLPIVNQTRVGVAVINEADALFSWATQNDRTHWLNTQHGGMWCRASTTIVSVREQ